MYRGIHVRVRPGEPLLPGRACRGRYIYTHIGVRICTYIYIYIYIYTHVHVDTCESSAGGSPYFPDVRASSGSR